MYFRSMDMKKLAPFFIIVLLLFAFGKNKKPKYSKYLTKNYVQVPGGLVHLNSNRVKVVKLDSLSLTILESDKDSCQTFFISKGEVSNIQYKEFLSYLKQTGRMEEYRANMIDSTVWRQEFTFTEPFVNYYYQHQAYNDYPVVGVTLTQAKAYANWLTEIFAMKNQEVKIAFSVPTKKQWIRAARGETSTVYAWEGPHLRNSKGVYLANFKTLDSKNIHYNEKTQKYEVLASHSSDGSIMITTPTESYYPNQFGVYSMCGNVAELVSDDTVAMGGSWNDTGFDIRVESEQSATKPKATIGFRVIATIEE